MKQNILFATEHYAELDRYFKENGIRKFLLVCDSSLPFLKINEYFSTLSERTGVSFVPFSDFKPNPLYESVVEGVNVFREGRCDAIAAVGGGSAMDVAKCIKLYATLDPSENYLKQEIVPNAIPLLAMPTTAGTGSESTRFAVVYYNGEKQSVAHESCIPSTVLLDPGALATLPAYQKKATMMDAFCHSIESFWSVNSTEESRRYSEAGIRGVMEHMEGYLSNTGEGNKNMLLAANSAGKAINITETTACHAMSYKITSLYGIAHGHSAAICLPHVWRFMLSHPDQCADSRGWNAVQDAFCKIAHCMGASSPEEAVEAFEGLLKRLELNPPAPRPGDLELLASSVNPVRLKNNPVTLREKDLYELYRQILSVS